MPKGSSYTQPAGAIKVVNRTCHPSVTPKAGASRPEFSHHGRRPGGQRTLQFPRRMGCFRVRGTGTFPEAGTLYSPLVNISAEGEFVSGNRWDGDGMKFRVQERLFSLFVAGLPTPAVPGAYFSVQIWGGRSYAEMGARLGHRIFRVHVTCPADMRIRRRRARSNV